ncbi:hypothetical protein [Clostridium fermenticellae]|uniref:hypothetical protein n=1 Tax=Clostridium fermenticellae TaxID=2068654 RepID=UPI001A9B3075|nr:hypothetical protein [Clostridium fermenticellae]
MDHTAVVDPTIIHIATHMIAVDHTADSLNNEKILIWIDIILLEKKLMDTPF